MAQTRLIGTAPEQVPTNGMLGTIAFQDASSVNLGSVSVQQLLGQVPAPLGTAGAPTFTFTGDLNTGIYSPGADQLALSTGGTGQLFITSAGNVGITNNVGIGTNSPSSRLTIVGGNVEITGNTSVSTFLNLVAAPSATGGANRSLVNFVDTAGTGGCVLRGSHDGGTFDIRTRVAGTETTRLTINYTTGNVGIGTISPGAQLEVNAAAATAPFIAKISTSEVARIDSSGRLLVGTSTSATSASIESIGAITVRRPAAVPECGLWRANGTLAAPTAVADSDLLGRLYAVGYDGTNYINAARIEIAVDGTPGASDMPGRLVFSTTADGAAAPTERLRIANDGRHTINSSAHQGTALTTTAPAKLYTSTGTYTDTATAASGTVTHGTIIAFDNPAIAATNATVTYTNASTVYIDGAPTNGTNVTITNPFALFVAAGASRFNGNVLSSSATGGIGYATGAGSAQTQTTSRTQGVTINTICGAITLFSAAGTTTWQSFTVTNSTVAATDTVIVNQKSGTDLYMIHVTNVAAGSFQITYATTGGTTTEQPVFNFSVIKAVAA